ncbi:hypothetical protein AVEN_177445-1 [Araneus ventricosus]|uniref:RNase H type-1 domain-containing protein n=1 Tax=Araneus ventricosus TaxID=182803 RepID=A0A4Y2LEP3_ARAVE|nr:hypothetical protein AVEN_177445-1 [Araneus ventricosus]
MIQELTAIQDSTQATNHKDKVSTVKFHPDSIDLENRVFFDQIFRIYEPINIYIDSSKFDDKTGCAFCVRENNISTAQWMTQFKPHHSVFQVELIAIKEAWLTANPASTPSPL